MGEEIAAILDAGAQYGKPIDRRVRESNVKTDLLPIDTPASVLKEKGYKAIIITGGPESVNNPESPRCDPEILSLDIPILGICYGAQLMSVLLGGKVETGAIREDGQDVIKIDNTSLLFKGLSEDQPALLTHGDSIIPHNGDFEVTGVSSQGIVAAMENVRKKIYGVQFHPEVDLTENGMRIFHNFLYNIAGFTGDFTLENRIEKAIQYIRATVGDKHVLVLVSGGVDSTVCAALLNKALGPERVHAIHIDNGFMRKNESAAVKDALQDLGLPLTVVHAANDFYDGTTTIREKTTPRLRDAVHPEEKRKIIGDTFMKVAERAIAELGLDPSHVVVAQGTLRPDLIESASTLASSKAQVIKTHHNDTQLVREKRARGEIVEPLTEYHKDEVRKVGRDLGLPDDIVERQPFPGPGLAVRIICAEKPYREEDFDILHEQLKGFSTPDIAATLLPIQTVGVQGDGRSYSYLAALSGKQEWAELFRIAKAIPRKLHRVNRLVYLFGDKVEGPVTDITPTHPTPDVIAQLQEADNIVNTILRKYNLLRKLSQVPVISFPVHFGQPGNRSIGIRTFITNDFMTGVPAIPGKEMPLQALEEMVSEIMMKVPGISRVAYDLTSKPPGTTEWE